jgi:hypothetical protein
MSNGGIAAGWYPDPSGAHESRYWNGTDWTADVASGGVTSSAPLGSPVAPPATATAPPPASGAATPLSAKDARAQAKAAKAYAKASRPFYKKKRYYLLALIVVIIIAAVAGGSSSSNKTNAASNGGTKTLSNNGTHPPQADVAITGCSADSLGDLQATVKVTNHSSGRSNYVIGIAFDSKDGKTQLDTTTVLVNNLDPGQSSNQTGTTLTTAKGSYTCKVTDVNRFAST